MKRTAALVLLPLFLAQCQGPRGVSVRDSSKPGTNAVTKERWQGREREHAAYEDGSADGKIDSDRGSPNNYQAHQGRFTAATEQAYREGYESGYGTAKPGTHEAALTNAQQAAHDAGYAAGLRDRRRNRGSDPDQYAGTYDAKFSSWFLDGYQEGFEGR